MRSILAAILLLTGLVIAPVAAVAEQLVDLYKVSVLVANQQTDERNVAATQAMAQLLVRVTGNMDIGSNLELAPYLKRAQNYVLQYGYSKTEQTLTLENGSEVPAIQLTFSFSEEAIEKLLRKLQLSIWPANRPGILVWLIEDRWSEGRTLVTDPKVHESLRAEALRRGLPLVFPIWDLQDQMAISIEQLWRFQVENLKTASARYQANVIVVGRYSRTSSGELRGVWQWLDGDANELMDARGVTEASLAAPLIDKVANDLAVRYAIVPGRDVSERVMIHIADVTAFDRYREILTYLENLEALRSVQLVKVEGTGLWLELYPESDIEHLQRALLLDRKLIAMESFAVTDGSINNPLLFRWYR